LTFIQFGAEETTPPGKTVWSVVT